MRTVHHPGPLDRHSEPVVVEVEFDDDEALTVADLAAALVQRPSVPPPGLIVDGRWCPPDTALDQLDLRVGSVVEPATTPPAPALAPDRLLAHVGGTRAGASVAVPACFDIGRGVSGPGRADDPTIAPVHVVVTGSGFAVADTGSCPLLDTRRRGEGELGFGHVLTIGTSQFEVREPVDDRPHALAAGHGRHAGVVPFNRPPRPTPSVVEGPVAVPAEPEPPGAVEPPSIAALVLPVVAGAALAFFFSPFMAVFTALGPVLSVGTWWERRRRSRQAHRRAVAAVAAEVERLVAAGPGLVASERRRRRVLVPDPAEVVRRARSGSVRLWERRSSDPDAYRIGIGVSPLPFTPELVAEGGEPAVAARAAVAEFPPLTDVPLEVVAGPGSIIGVVGPPASRQALARALLLQVAVHHGPADVAALIAVSPDAAADWRWAEWLPHTADPALGSPGSLVTTTADVAAADAALAWAGDSALVVGVLDDEAAFEGRATVGRRLQRSSRSAIVALASHVHQLPAGTSIVVDIDEWGRITATDPASTSAGRRGLGWGVPISVADDAARSLAHLDDPDVERTGAGVPDGVSLRRLLGLGGSRPADDVVTITERWRRTRGTADLVAPIGADEHGPVELDLVGDGPHVLVGGTTGAGKSELLRSLVASLAASADPDHVAFVLVDYKGGAAFDCCADLPHVAGLVTDLDPALASRALRCLDAELRHREHRLREVGAEDLRAFRAITADRSGTEPLPRLVLVIDEFASLAADLPDFLDALVGIAQRGRSLGVHIVLATQRPAGVVTDDIKANAGCRIALRVTDAAESRDVIDTADAADIPRSRPGRAVARLGPGDGFMFQSALVTGVSDASGPIRVRPVDGAAARASADPGRSPTDLERLVAAVRHAHGDRPPPRSPWPEPLPAVVATDLDDPHAWWLIDDPDRQRQVADGWSPSDGHLVVVGGPGSGTSTTLSVAAVAAAATGAHVHAIDFDGSQSGLASMAATGTIASPTDAERRVRLLRRLVAEVRARQEVGAAESRVPIVVVVDDIGGLGRAHDRVRDVEPHDALEIVWADGPPVGVVCAVGAKRAADLTPAMLASAPTVLLHRVVDPGEVSRFGVRELPLDPPPGRAVRIDDQALLQVRLPGGSLAAAIAARVDGRPDAAPWRLGRLEPEIPLASVGSAIAEPWSVTFAVRDHDLGPTGLVLDPGDHALVVGPRRSGKTNTLEAVGRLARRPVVVGAPGTQLALRLGVEAITPEALPSVGELDGATLLIDDADGVCDPAGRLLDILDPASGVHVVAAARPDRLRNAFGHWSHELRASRVGVLLQPDTLDGDLLGATLPGRLDLPARPGRGFIANRGVLDSVQVAFVDEQSRAGQPSVG